MLAVPAAMAPSTAALVLDIAQGGSASAAGGGGGRPPTTSMPSWTSPATSTRLGAVGGSPIAPAVAGSEHAAWWLARDVAQELGRLAEGGTNLDPLAGTGAAVALAGAMLAARALDRGARAGHRPGAARRALRAVAVVGAHDFDAELDVAGDLGPAPGLAVELVADRGGDDLDGAHVLEAALAVTSKELGTGVLQRGGEITDANVTALDPQAQTLDQHFPRAADAEVPNREHRIGGPSTTVIIATWPLSAMNTDDVPR